ncbi:MAG: hypothetical protein WC788_05095 [Candidatus Paceibacterota bacterium]|jgi:hypothetical protein
MAEIVRDVKRAIREIMGENEERINLNIAKMLEADPDGGDAKKNSNIGVLGNIPETLMDAVGALPVSSIIGMDRKKRLVISNRRLMDL